MNNVITGDSDYLEFHLGQAIQRAICIRMIVSFVMESGVKTILPYLREAVDRNIPIQLLTGRYLSITEPSAIYLLYNQLGGRIDIRFYSESVRPFHPKSYIFDYEDDSEVFVGSSNISRSALTNGIEWNYRFSSRQHPDDYLFVSNSFDKLFHYHALPARDDVLKDYALSWRKPALVRSVDIDKTQPDKYIPEPQGAQNEALYFLKQARLEGVQKGVVIAATGVGKTHLAAFDSLPFNRVLFIAHREEIVRQAYQVFHSLRPKARFGFYIGGQKDSGADIYFSTIQTLTRTENLLSFDPEYFDYIVMDEFHHAAADSYIRVLQYFHPQFLLGLTATPYRMDNRDIFALCDDNVIYEISLKQAIERDLLVPFRYYAIYDPTNYDQIEMVNGHYVVEKLEKQLSKVERSGLVFKHYCNISASRTLGFCVSIKHAEYMAEYFRSHGVPAVAVHSGSNRDTPYDRLQAVKALEKGEIKVLFTVDMFNEGVDIPSVDSILFLRPTESYVVFLQQLGRGLRKHPDKESVVVLDFIGNYKRAHYIPLLLAGENPWTNQGAGVLPLQNQQFPEGCYVNFDFRVIDLFKTLAANDPLPVRMRDTYWRLKQILQRRPGRKDIYEGSDIPIREYLKEGWLRYLHSVGELQSHEQEWLDTPAEEFLVLLEQTRFTKSYKIPTIRAFLRNGGIVSRVALQDIGRETMKFFTESILHQRDLTGTTNKDWAKWGVKEYSRLARTNPVKFLSQGSFFNYDEVNKVMYLDSSIEPYLSPQLAEHVKDILEYRETDYFRRRFKE